jgi:hypothetical protein
MGYLGFIATVLAVNVPRLSSVYQTFVKLKDPIDTHTR